MSDLTISTYRPSWMGGYYAPIEYVRPWARWVGTERTTLWIGFAWTGQVVISWRRG